MYSFLKVINEYEQMILNAERHIWNNPETGYREYKTTEYLISQFKKLGYEEKDIIRAENTTGFTALKEYLSAQVAWDNDVNMSNITADFFRNYYRDAAEDMYAYYTEYRMKILISVFWSLRLQNTMLRTSGLYYCRLQSHCLSAAV